jgi:hypothetical protein
VTTHPTEEPDAPVDDPPPPGWALRVTFAQHFREARATLDHLAPPDPHSWHGALAYAQAHALAAIAAALDPDTAATVASASNHQGEIITKRAD